MRQRARRRRGITLIIVVGLLFLFSGLALAFSLIARSETAAARNFKRRFVDKALPAGANADTPDPEPIFRDVLSQIIFDTPITRPASALRGHSLLRDMYGGNEVYGFAVGDFEAGADPRGNNLAHYGDPDNVNLLIPTGPYAMGSIPGQQYPLPTAYPNTFGVGSALQAGMLPFRNWWRNAFNGNGIPYPKRPVNPVTDQGTMVYSLLDPYRPVPSSATVTIPSPWQPWHYPFNFTRFDALSAGSRAQAVLAEPFLRIPERYPQAGGATITVPPATLPAAFNGKQRGTSVHYFGYDEDYDYPDHNNMFLAMERADGEVIIPSYHRPQLLADLERRGGFASGSAAGTAWSDDQGWRIILRPRRREYAGGPGVPVVTLPGIQNPLRNNGTGFNPALNAWKDLVDKDGSGCIGDSSLELDVDTDGDGKPDSVWIDFGSPIFTDAGGQPFKALAAIKIVDVTGRIPLNTAGNLVGDPNLKGHASNLGASAAEINPKHAFLLEYNAWSSVGTAGISYKALLQGMQSPSPPNAGFPGRYNGSSGTDVTLGGSVFAGTTSTDDANTSAVPPAFRTPFPPTISKVMPNKIGFQDYQDYPAGLLERRWRNRSHPGYNNPNQYQAMWNGTSSNLGTALAPSSLFGLRDDIGRGQFFLPGSTGSISYPAGWPTSSIVRDVMGVPYNYERQQTASGGAPAFANAETDEPTEWNPYESDGSTAAIDYPLSVNMFDLLYRFADADSEGQDPTLVRLLRTSVDSSGSLQNAGESVRDYARSRVRRMFAPATWDLINYSAPPAFGLAGNVFVPLANDPPGYEDVSPRGDVAGVTVAGSTIQNRHLGVFDGAVPRDGIFWVPEFSYEPTSSASPVFTIIGMASNPVNNGTLLATATGTPVAAGPLPASPGASTIGAAGEFDILSTGSHIVNPVQLIAAGNFSVFHPSLTGVLTTAAPHGTATAPFNLYPREILEGRRFNLNRPLRPYRDQDPSDLTEPSLQNAAAEADRQIMAAQIYMLLRAATHTPDGDPRIDMLAQLAVNIVDNIDSDDVVTRFWYDRQLKDNNWDPANAAVNANTNVVYGFEMPRLVVSEAAAFTLRNNPNTSGNDDTWLFTEISNPWPTDSTNNLGASKPDELQVGPGFSKSVLPIEPAVLTDIAPSQITWRSRSLARTWRMEVEFNTAAGIEKQNSDFNSTGAKLQDDTPTAATRGREIRGKSNNTGIDDRSFFLVGPDVAVSPLPMSDPLLPNNLDPSNTTNKDIDYRLSRSWAGPAPTDSISYLSRAGAGVPASITIRLLRLRNPYERPPAVGYPPTAAPAANTGGYYNPYVTMDQVTITPTGATQGIWNITSADPTFTPIGNRKSWERKHPWRIDGGLSGASQHSFTFRGGAINRYNVTQESGIQTKQYFIMRMDRPLASPLELLHTRLFSFGPTVTDPRVNLTVVTPPALNFTSLFNPTVTPDPFRPTWYRDDVKTAGALAIDLGDLFRLFEFVETPSRFRGSGHLWQSFTGSNVYDSRFDYPDFRVNRVAGKMNINSITAEESLRALLDSDEANPIGFPPEKGGTPMPWTSLGAPFVATSAAYPNIPGGLLFNRQYPTDNTGTLGPVGFPTAGTAPNSLVNAEIFKRYLSSLAGADFTLGTLDDQPFRSFAQRSINDTILRGYEVAPAIAYTADGALAGSASISLRRLFDLRSSTFGGANDPPANTDLFDANKTLAKIAGNVTTRGNVYACWITIGWFRVIPGTETRDVPLLNEELDSGNGANVRRRCFAIIDRTLATGYQGPKTINDPAQEPVIRYFKVIE